MVVAWICRGCGEFQQCQVLSLEKPSGCLQSAARCCSWELQGGGRTGASEAGLDAVFNEDRLRTLETQVNALQFLSKDHGQRLIGVDDRIDALEKRVAALEEEVSPDVSNHTMDAASYMKREVFWPTIPPPKWIDGPPLKQCLAVTRWQFKEPNRMDEGEWSTPAICEWLDDTDGIVCHTPWKVVMTADSVEFQHIPLPEGK